MPTASQNTNITAVLGQPLRSVIDARSDLYSSGLPAAAASRGGVLPDAIQLPAGARTVTVTRVTGLVGCGTSDPPAGPDGGHCAGGTTDIQSERGISGVVDNSSTQFLAGVFLAAQPPATAPARLDFSPPPAGLGHHFATLAPALGQLFFIGAGTGHSFSIPAGATTLYLGIADAFAFHGMPTAYGDNTGGFQIEAVVIR